MTPSLELKKILDVVPTADIDAAPTNKLVFKLRESQSYFIPLPTEKANIYFTE